jgi:hypothetical protein
MHVCTSMFLACLSVGNAVAAQWSPIADFPQLAAEIDVDSVATKGALVKATFRFTYPLSQKSSSSGELYRSAEVKSLFDCKAGSFVPMHRREFSETLSRGRIVGAVSLHGGEPKLEKIISGSMNEIMHNKACSLSADRHR